MKKLSFLALPILLLLNCKSEGQELEGHIGRPDISPDGTKIVFIYARDASKDVWEIYSADIDGKNVRQLTTFPEARIKKGPVWSPDGQSILFHADIEDGAQIFIMGANGENLYQLTQLPGYNVEPIWSPTGGEIIFNSILEQGKAKMFIMDRDGSRIRELYNPEGENWYPRKLKGDKILFTSDFKQRDTHNVFSMNSDGSDIRQLTFLEGINWFPEISPNMDKIVFNSNKDDPELRDSGNYNLYIMNTDGSGMERITNLPGQELHAKWHPDGDKLVFEWHDPTSKGLYLLELSTGNIRKIRLIP
ncbi:hypothetical protein [Ulvibacterium sp.]|uniref:hypothetical protein n=1 Tax=Ulvibacterium sp. TaxID=2665914 RepID=UPI003BAACBA5